MANFDKIIDRKKTHALKLERYKKYENAVNMWVADMDFKSPKCITKALKKRINHEVFGYTVIDEDTKQTIKTFLKKRHNYKIENSHIAFTSGVVASMNIVCNMFGKKDSVVIVKPIYPYFFTTPKHFGQKVISVNMKNINNRWMFDFDELESKIDKTCRLLFICNPHNPGGTVFTKEELLKIGEIAIKHNLIICSDEIHSDLVLDKDVKHIPIASLSDKIAQRTITLMAPSKTFNIAGLQSSFAIIENKELMDKFVNSMGHINGGVNLLGIEATRAAYKYGEKWLEELLEYLRENLKIVENFISKNPKLKLLKCEATYLAWIDCSELKTDAYKLFLDNGVVLNEGKSFGDGGENFVRLNFGTSRKTLLKALNRMQIALRSCDKAFQK